MSGSDAPKKPPLEGQGDLAMEDILASIRRILKEDTEAGAQPTPEPAEAGQRPAPEPEGVLLLDESMMVAEPKPTATSPTPSDVPPATEPPATAVDAPMGAGSASLGQDGAEAALDAMSRRLLAPEAAAATAASLGSLVRTLANERNTLVHRGGQAGGPTIEELVREELRPFLKAWLDQHLPALVERVVRAEIDRVLGSSLP